MHDPLRILHLEDDPLDRELVEATLVEGGFSCKIRHVETRTAFTQAIEEGEIDIILADYSLPAFDGITALEISRQRLPVVPFILVSGALGEDPAIEAMRSGATDYVLKQKLSRLVPAVQRALMEAENSKNLASKERALHKALYRLQLQIRFMPLACIVWDPEYRIREWNPAAECIFGWSEAEACDKDIRELIVPPEEHELRFVQMEKILAEGGGSRTISVNTTKSGKRITCEWFRTHLKDEAGNLAGVLSMANDITEEKKAEEALAQSLEQLRQSQKIEAVGRLAGGVAHDFNNLLTVITGYCELMMIKIGEGNPLLQDLQEVSKSADRAAGLTRQLLAFSRRQILQPKVLEIDTLVPEMDKMLRRLIGEDIDLVTILGADAGKVKFDPGQIEQVIANLVINSRDAMPDGGAITIETANVELDQAFVRKHGGAWPGPHVMLAVSDTGCGMSPEILSKAFDPFFTTKEKGKGTGLGLSTVFGIVNQSGGCIYVYSEPGRGTTMKIYLPRVTGETSPKDEKRDAGFEDRLHGSETILIVEDEETLRKLASSILEGYGYTVLTAGDGEEALQLLSDRQGIPHLVLTDVVMPKMGGRGLSDRIKSIHPGTRVLFMSGYTDNAIVHQGVLNPGVSYLQKPFTPKALARKVREVLDGK
jgi:two-component system, cell cycle sensor histidine kinase and response regulator CckA